MTAGTASASSLFPWTELVDQCKNDPRLWFFVGRESARGEDADQLVDWSAVLAESDQDRAFVDATALPSHATYATLASANAQSTAALAELTEQLSWTSLFRFFIRVPGAALLVATLGLAAVRHDYLALPGQLAAIGLAPVSGLIWRSGRLRHSTGLLALAGLLAAAGLVALVTPLVFGLSFPYWSWFLIVTSLGITGTFALDHSNRPQLRDIKILLLMPKDRRREKRAIAAREDWLTEAREIAVNHELTQTINRLLAPEWDKRLLVRNTVGLRAIYHEQSQVPTVAAQRADTALRRSDGASIAVSGPRGSGKTNLLTELCMPESRFSVLVSAPTRYAPREFLIQLFQELCVTYIRDQRGPGAAEAGKREAFARFLRENCVVLLKVALTLLFTGLLTWDLVSRSAARDADNFPRSLWADQTAFYAIVLCVLILVSVPKRLGQRWRETRLVAIARRYHAELRAEQTATAQVAASLPMMQATFSRASRSLPWTMPELVGRLREFLGQVADAELHGKRRRVLICIDEVDRIGSAQEATNFLSEVKAIFGAPHCYFVVAIADELGIQLNRRATASRPLSDNAFDEIISVEPMSFDMCRDLLTRRVLGFTESFVWLSLVLSGGSPRELIRVARRLAEMAIDSDYDIRLAGCAEQLVREEIYEAAADSRRQLAEMPAGGRWAAALDELRMQVKVFESGGKPTDMRAVLLEFIGLPASLPADATPETKFAAANLAALALLGITTRDAFQDTCFDITALRDPGTGKSAIYEELATARRELAVSADTCRVAVEKVRKDLRLDEQPEAAIMLS
jgi:hypothetical protein